MWCSNEYLGWGHTPTSTHTSALSCVGTVPLVTQKTVGLDQPGHPVAESFVLAHEILVETSQVKIVPTGNTEAALKSD